MSASFWRPSHAASPERVIRAWTADADAVQLSAVKEAEARIRPASAGLTYAELEHHSLADEQRAVWQADGEQAARPHQTRACGLKRSADATEVVLGHHEQELTAAQADHQHAARTLTPHVTRSPGAKLRYRICWPLLVGGDASGVWAAAVYLGEEPFIAFWQALACGVAAGCAGLVGGDLKHLQGAKQREQACPAPSDDELRYQRLFGGARGGIGIVRLICLLSLVVVVLVAVGIFALRSSAEEGGAGGLTFGLLAAATAIASGLLGYSAADEVADLIDICEQRVRRIERRLLRLASGGATSRLAEAEEAAYSVRLEHDLRGTAAARRRESLAWRIMRRNPSVVGHGFAAGEPSGVIGRRMRRSADEL